MRPARSPTRIALVAWTLACLLAVGSLPSASAATHPLASVVPMGMSAGDVAALQQLGAPPAFASFWVGAWMAQYGWGGLDNALAQAKASGTTPLLYWYYWGDSISPACVESGCNGLSRAQWDAMTQTLVQRIQADMGGAPVYVVLENEFNKNGIDSSSYAPTFDGYLAAKAATLHTAAGVRVVLGYGGWGEGNWGLFPKAIAASDALGFQTMRASTGDTEASYRAAPDRIAQLLNVTQQIGGKGAFLYDLALSSYPDAYWAQVQAQTLANVTAREGEYASHGLQGIIYRSLHDDPGMSPANYYGYAEQHWGLRDTSDAAKPAWAAWLAAYAPVNHPPVASMTTSASGLTVAVDGSSSSDPDGDALAYAWSFGDGASATGATASHAYAASGTYTVTLTVSDGQASSSASATVTVQQPNRPPVASFAASGANLSWSFDASASSDPDGDALAYAWDFGDGATATGVGATHAYAAAGTYTVTLTATDTHGASASTTRAVTATSPPPPAPFAASFSPYGGNNWWVQATVGANQPLSSVCASVNGGACQPLSLRSWGAWAASFYVPTNAMVRFTATSATTGASITSLPYWWPSGTLAFTATFSPYGGNNWWVQTNVNASLPLAGVCASVNGGACQALQLQSWGAWAASFYVATGAKVTFTATSTDGQKVTSAAYKWPVK
jgi:PKD repeat protein